MKESNLTLGLVQIGPKETVKESLDYAIEKIVEASKNGAEVICLPELFCHNYFPQQEDNDVIFREAESLDGNTIRKLSKIAKETNSVLVGGSIFEKSKGHYYNTAPVFESNGELMGYYRKTHLPQDPYFYEQNYFERGDTYKIFHTSKGKIAPLICFDQWFPQAAVEVSSKGADLIIYPTAIGNVDDMEMLGETEDWEYMWKQIQIGNAIRNSVYIAAVNRVGKEDKIDFWGKSFVTDPAGKVLSEGGSNEEIIIQDLNLKYASELREAWGFFKESDPSLLAINVGSSIRKKAVEALQKSL